MCEARVWNMFRQVAAESEKEALQKLELDTSFDEEYIKTLKNEIISLFENDEQSQLSVNNIKNKDSAVTKYRTVLCFRKNKNFDEKNILII